MECCPVFSLMQIWQSSGLGIRAPKDPNVRPLKLVLLEVRIELYSRSQFYKITTLSTKNLSQMSSSVKFFHVCLGRNQLSCPFNSSLTHVYNYIYTLRLCQVPFNKKQLDRTNTCSVQHCSDQQSYLYQEEIK